MVGIARAARLLAHFRDLSIEKQHQKQQSSLRMREVSVFFNTHAEYLSSFRRLCERS